MSIEDPDMAYRDPESSINEEERTNALLSNTRCRCFCFPCFGSRRSSTVGLAWWERIRKAQIQTDDQWWARGIRAIKKLREWSEIVAGPRWKTFIRRFNRKRSGGARHGKFQYDPLSYALNFDEGSVQNGSLDEEIDDYSGFRNFSARFASVPVSVKNNSVVAGPSKAQAVFG